MRLCQVDAETAQRFRENLAAIRNDCAIPKLTSHHIPRVSDVSINNMLTKTDLDTFAQKSSTILDDLDRQNSIYDSKIARCNGHRFTLHEARHALNRDFPPSCTGYQRLIEESKKLEKDISNMVTACESHIKWNIEVSKRVHALLEYAHSRADKVNLEPARLPASVGQ